VQAFWVLSGVVFAVTYCRADVSFGLRDFAVRRFSRLYPLHFATLLVVAAIQALSLAVFGRAAGLREQRRLSLRPAALLRLQLGLPGRRFLQRPDLERLGRDHRLCHVRRLRARRPRAASRRHWPSPASASSAGCCRTTSSSTASVLFFLGVAASLGVTWLAGLLSKRSLLSLGLALPSFGVAVAAAVVWSGQIDRLPTALTLVCLPVAIAGLVCLDHARPPVPASLGWIGAITYATYLTHMPILMVMKMIIAALGWQERVSHPATLALFLGTVIAVSIPVYRRFEVPAQRWLRDRLLPAAPAAIPAPRPPEEDDRLRAGGVRKDDDLRHA
jgi:peptidoglycan/LPS O-acetylase OafA/YrhL